MSRVSNIGAVGISRARSRDHLSSTNPASVLTGVIKVLKVSRFLVSRSDELDGSPSPVARHERRCSDISLCGEPDMRRVDAEGDSRGVQVQKQAETRSRSRLRKATIECLERRELL